MLGERLVAAVEEDHGFHSLVRDVLADECLAPHLHFSMPCCVASGLGC
jgi:hypothetical protein